MPLGTWTLRCVAPDVLWVLYLDFDLCLASLISVDTFPDYSLQCREKQTKREMSELPASTTDSMYVK